MTIRYSPSAIVLLDQQPRHIRSKLIDDLVWLHQHPYLVPDSGRIIPYDMPPLVGKLYRDESHWIVFLLEGSSPEQTDLIVCNIGLATEEPHLWRRP